MGFRITYCVQWNYEPMAVSLADKLEQSFDASVELVRGSNGIFDVEQENNLIYSKHESGEFPNEERLINELKSITQ